MRGRSLLSLQYIINPRRACAARVTVLGSVCLSVKSHLTSRMSNRAIFHHQFFTAILRHGYMPKCFRDCVLVPIPKGGANLSSSDGYRPISIASCLSKVLERIILNQYSSILSSHHLQFGFKTGSSTSLCTGIVKCVVSRYIPPKWIVRPWLLSRRK